MSEHQSVLSSAAEPVGIPVGMDYSHKPAGYFGGNRKEFVDLLPPNPTGRLLEIGAGSGATSAYALAEGKCGWCCGVELCEGPAVEARKKLQQVVIGDVERMELDFPEKYFDVLLMSEVLEHLADPWALLRRLRPLLKPGALVVSGSPNICDYEVILTLLRGQWRYEERGVYDRTHLRWFSPTSYREMFEECGYLVDDVSPARKMNPKARLFNFLTGRRLQYLLHSQIVLRAHCPETN